jgi:CheY-like chemotaxis protein
VAQNARPDLILLDIIMPDMNGIEVSRRLRVDPATATIPIAAMSAVDNLRLASRMPVDDRLETV